jgi:hypothetical protein
LPGASAPMGARERRSRVAVALIAREATALVFSSAEPTDFDRCCADRALGSGADASAGAGSIPDQTTSGSRASSAVVATTGAFGDRSSAAASWC